MPCDPWIVWRVAVILNNPFDRDARLLIEESVLQTVIPYRQTTSTLAEAGGILLGLRRGDHLHVVKATVPGRADRRDRLGFLRFNRTHAQTARLEWENSEKTMDYFGEWHTHPEDRPRPSGLDLREWRKISKRRGEPMVFMIVSITEEWVGIGIRDQIKACIEYPSISSKTCCEGI
jgi:integrative and conjugative element protein (TIGR02256 family)